MLVVAEHQHGTLLVRQLGHPRPEGVAVDHDVRVIGRVSARHHTVVADHDVAYRPATQPRQAGAGNHGLDIETRVISGPHLVPMPVRFQHHILHQVTGQLPIAGEHRRIAQ